MNTDLTSNDIFRSSISILSIKPNHYQTEEFEFFKHRTTDEGDIFHDIQKTEFVKAIPENQSPLYGSLLDKILFTTHQEEGSNSNELNTWIAFNNQIGCSEQDSEQIQIPQRKNEKMSLLKKSKSIVKSKFYLLHQSDKLGDKNQQLSRKFQNETKNIPKNYGKAIIAYSLKNFKRFEHMTEFASISFQDFKKQLVQKRKSINSIAGLKSLWMDFKYSKCMRLLSNQFLRRHSLSYIFNSRISNVSPHVKYRYKLCEAIRQPLAFSYIKDY